MLTRPIFLLGFLAFVIAGAREGPTPSVEHGAFVVHQRSYWLSDGIDPSGVASVDTTLTITPDSDSTTASRYSFRYEFAPAHYAQASRGTGDLAVGVSRLPVMTLGQPRKVFENSAGALTTALAQLPEWFVPHPRGPQAARTDTIHIRMGFGRDTVDLTHVRGMRPLDSLSHRGWVTDSGALRLLSVTTTEVELQDSTRVQATLSGWICDTLLLDAATGRVDSVRSFGELRGVLVFRYVTGRADSISGKWVLERDGGWGPDPSERARARMHYFVVHGRDSVAPATSRSQSRSVFTENGDTLTFDSLVNARAKAKTPFDRFAVDSALWLSGVPDSNPVRFIRAGAASYRPGSETLLLRLLMTWEFQSRPSRATGLEPDLARVLAKQLGSLRAEHAVLLDREKIFSTLVSALGNRNRGAAVSVAAAAIFADAAQRTDDPDARDLFLLGAYEGDPSKYLPLLQRLADSVAGFGPIARQYAKGNNEMTSWSWGLSPGQRIQGMAFPGVHAGWRELSQYIERNPDEPVTRRQYGFGWRSSNDSQPKPVLDQWLRAHGVDGHAEFRRRFTDDTDERARVVSATYVLMWGDTLPVPWLRQVGARDNGDVSNRAWNLLLEHVTLADTVRDAAILTEIQSALLKDLTGEEPLADTTGEPPRHMAAHNERPDESILLLDHLTDSTRALWRQTFTLMSRDSVRSLAKQHGLQMAWEISVVSRYKDVYAVSLDLHPYGAMCLCGGGSSYLLTRRHGKWVVLSVGSWVS